MPPSSRTQLERASLWRNLARVMALVSTELARVSRCSAREILSLMSSNLLRCESATQNDFRKPCRFMDSISSSASASASRTSLTSPPCCSRLSALSRICSSCWMTTANSRQSLFNTTASAADDATAPRRKATGARNGTFCATCSSAWPVIPAALRVAAPPSVSWNDAVRSTLATGTSAVPDPGASLRRGDVRSSLLLMQPSSQHPPPPRPWPSPRFFLSPSSFLEPQHD
mmetsp:Transcript_35015/g.75838  ORF Transcript_35015/g.75838 Transcript_35015/m.75838 type:complete len:229 (+) Transcript_35015:439-1125(+)